jgi:Tetratricopeptide repeat
VGFTRDGTAFGYCGFGGGIEPQVLTCEFLDAAGHTTARPRFTYTFSVPAAPLPFLTAWVNGLVLSPDSSEAGIVAGFLCMEWCDDFVVGRIPLRTLASRVFNDTGMRHHTKKEYAASARLFARAVQADPGNALAAYNLACALARLGDPDAERALEVAVRLGGDEVRARAAKDDDLRGLRVDAIGSGAGAK